MYPCASRREGGGQAELERLADAEEGAAEGFARAAIKLEAVVEADEEVRSTDADADSAGFAGGPGAEVAKAVVDVADVDEGDAVKDARQGEADFVVEDEEGVATGGRDAIEEARADAVLGEAADGGAPAGEEAFAEADTIRRAAARDEVLAIQTAGESDADAGGEDEATLACLVLHGEALRLGQGDVAEVLTEVFGEVQFATGEGGGVLDGVGEE